MKIELFTVSTIESSFELGGLEFYGERGCFTKEMYKSQDLQMVFIILCNFSFAIREEKSKFTFSSNITFIYKEKSNTFFVNGILIDKLTYVDMLECLHDLVESSIHILQSNLVTDSDPVLSDLNYEFMSLKEKISAHKG